MNYFNLRRAQCVSTNKIDPYHLMDRIHVHKEHSMRAAFKRDLRDAIFESNVADLEKIKEIWGAGHRKLNNERYIRKRVRRKVPSKELLKTKIESLCDRYFP